MLLERYQKKVVLFYGYMDLFINGHWRQEFINALKQSSAIISVLQAFFNAIFCLIDHSSDPLTFRPQKRDKQVALGWHLVAEQLS